MAIGRLQNERELENFIRQTLDRNGIRPLDLTRLLETGGRQLQVRVGVQNLTWAAGAAISSVVTVSHGLTGNVLGVLAFQQSSGGPSNVVAMAQNVDADSFDLYGEFRILSWGAGGTIPFFWVAVAELL